jgi:cytochrome c-type biogenesis protein CcmH
MVGLVLFPGQASAALYDEIQESLICPACLDDRMTVAACNDSTAEQTRQDIQQRLASGQTKEQIIEAYVQQYGETILAVPRKSGFNLVAWVIPPVAVLGGTALVYYAVTGWVRNSGNKRLKNLRKLVIDDIDEERLNDEMKKYL